MTTDRAALVEKVAGKFREMTTLERLRSGPFTWDELASAALDIALEEAAKVVEDPSVTRNAAGHAAAIRALKG